MTNCTITLDVTGFGYTYLLQLDAMLGDFLSDGDNAAAADALHDWIGENARNFADDARATGDDLAADLFSDLAADLEGGNDPEEEPATEEPAPAADALRDNPEYRTWDDALVWLDQMPAHDKRAYDPWKIVEEAARIHSTGAGERNIFEAGRIYGMACAIAAICPVEGADADWWLGYIEDYAEANYEDGARVDL